MRKAAAKRKARSESDDDDEEERGRKREEAVRGKQVRELSDDEKDGKAGDEKKRKEKDSKKKRKHDSSSSDSESSDSDSDSSSEEERRKRRKKRSRSSKRDKKSRKSSRRSSKKSRKSRRSPSPSSSSSEDEKLKKKSKSKERSRSASKKRDASSDEEDEYVEKPSTAVVAAEAPATGDSEQQLARIEGSVDGGATDAHGEGGDEDDEDDWAERKVDAPVHVGPMPLPKMELGHGGYGGAMMPGEAEAYAKYVQENKRIPRRGEVGLSSDEIEKFETLGYVMSGSRHKRYAQRDENLFVISALQSAFQRARGLIIVNSFYFDNDRMNAVRIRKENQVYSAEEKRALALFNYEEKAKRENKILAEFRDMIAVKFGTINPSGSGGIKPPSGDE
jgi:hypothetical protein